MPLYIFPFADFGHASKLMGEEWTCLTKQEKMVNIKYICVIIGLCTVSAFLIGPAVCVQN